MARPETRQQTAPQAGRQTGAAQHALKAVAKHLLRHSCEGSESSVLQSLWVPACAGTTAKTPFCDRQPRYVEADVKTQYAGLFNIGFGMDEVMLLFCNPSVDSGVIKVESKVAMSLKNAKRLALALGKLLSQYEAAHGPVGISAVQGHAIDNELKR